jgi:hypothetical protein
VLRSFDGKIDLELIEVQTGSYLGEDYRAHRRLLLSILKILKQNPSDQLVS